jgi:hypothetical protein
MSNDKLFAILIFWQKDNLSGIAISAKILGFKFLQ